MTTDAVRAFAEYEDTIVGLLGADLFVPLYDAIAAAGVAPDPGIVVARCVDACPIHAKERQVRAEFIEKYTTARNRAVGQAVGLLRKWVKAGELAEIETILRRTEYPEAKRRARRARVDTTPAIAVRDLLMAAGLSQTRASEHAQRIVNRLVTHVELSEPDRKQKKAKLGKV